MPHAVMEGPVSALVFYRRFTPFAVRGGDEVRRVRSCWLKNGGDEALLDCLLAGEGPSRRFFIRLTTAGRRTAVRLDFLGGSSPPGARALLAAVAERLEAFSPEMKLVATDLRPWPRNEPCPETPSLPASPAAGKDGETTSAEGEEAEKVPPPADCELTRYLRDDAPEPLDWGKVFGRVAPLVVEIGCGGGRRLLEAAAERPEYNHLGIEYAREYYKTLRERVLSRGPANVRIYGANAAYLIRRFFPGNSVREYHIYFPDPWPKKRHRKRRLLRQPFCAELFRTLEDAGVIYIASDHLEYYEEFLPLFQALFEVKELEGPWPDAPEGRTNFEIKYLREGRPIRRFIARKSAVGR